MTSTATETPTVFRTGMWVTMSSFKSLVLEEIEHDPTFKDALSTFLEHKVDAEYLEKIKDIDWRAIGLVGGMKAYFSTDESILIGLNHTDSGAPETQFKETFLKNGKILEDNKMFWASDVYVLLGPFMLDILRLSLLLLVTLQIEVLSSDGQPIHQQTNAQYNGDVKVRFTTHKTIYEPMAKDKREEVIKDLSEQGRDVGEYNDMTWYAIPKGEVTAKNVKGAHLPSWSTLLFRALIHH